MLLPSARQHTKLPSKLQDSHQSNKLLASEVEAVESYHVLNAHLVPVMVWIKNALQRLYVQRWSFEK